MLFREHLIKDSHGHIVGVVVKVVAVITTKVVQDTFRLDTQVWDHFHVQVYVTTQEPVATDQLELGS
jgi:hypothetical protein